MNAAWWVLAGFVGGALAGILVADFVMSWRVYWIFPQQSRRRWPGSGFWMVWRIVLFLRGARNMLANVHAAATMFPLGSHHSDATREFVETIRNYSNVNRKPESKS